MQLIVEAPFNVNWFGFRSVISDTPVVTMGDDDQTDMITRQRPASEGGSPCGSLEKDVSNY